MLMNKDILNFAQFLQLKYKFLKKKHEVLLRDFDEEKAIDDVYELFCEYINYSPINVANCYHNFNTLMFLPVLPESRGVESFLDRWSVDLIPKNV